MKTTNARLRLTPAAAHALSEASAMGRYLHHPYPQHSGAPALSAGHTLRPPVVQPGQNA